MAKSPMRKILPACLLAFAWCAAAGSQQALAGEVIRVNGSGAALDMMTLLNDAYQKLHPETRIEMLKPLGSSGAIKALLAGALDLAVSSKTLLPEQVSLGAQSLEFGVTPLVIVTERSVHKTDITTRELEEIYRGTANKWPDGEPIRIVLRPQTDIDTAILRRLSPAMNSAVDTAQSRPGMVTAVTDPEANDMIAKMPGAIGSSALCSLLVAKPPLNALSLNGVTPRVSALADRSYPLSKDIRFITKGAPPPAVAAFLAFIYSARGRSIAEGAGVLVTAGGPAGKNP